MTEYKLYYFNARGRAELCRLLFAFSNTEYEDIRITKEEWPEEKKKTPLGTLPYLVIDGKSYGQSMAIARHLARLFSLDGKNAVESLECDIIVDCLADLSQPIMQIIFIEQEESKKEAMMDKFVKETLPNLLTRLEEKVGEQGFFVGEDITWADIAFINSADIFLKMDVAALNNFPKLTALKNKVEEHPNIKEWLSKRPQTAF